MTNTTTRQEAIKRLNETADILDSYDFKKRVYFTFWRRELKNISSELDAANLFDYLDDFKPEAYAIKEEIEEDLLKVVTNK